MKKWLIGCLTVLAMVCLIPGIALNAKAESLYCRYCDKFTDCEILGYEKFDSSFHTLHIKCKSCSKENDVIDSKYSKHTDDGKTPPVPQAKPVPYAARNTIFPVTYGARGRLTATARTPADARTPTATQKKRTYPAAATPTRPASARERAPLAKGGTTAITNG